EDPPQDCVRQEETRTAGNPAGAIVGDATACNEAVNVRVIEQPLIPGVEHGGDGDPRPQAAVGHFEQRLRDRVKEQVESEGGCPAEEGVERRGHGEYGVEVGHRQKRLFLRLGPECLIEGATAGAVTVPTGVVGKTGIATLVALLEVTPKFSSAAGDEVADHA